MQVSISDPKGGRRSPAVTRRSLTSPLLLARSRRDATAYPICDDAGGGLGPTPIVTDKEFYVAYAPTSTFLGMVVNPALSLKYGETVVTTRSRLPGRWRRRSPRDWDENGTRRNYRPVPP